MNSTTSIVNNQPVTREVYEPIGVNHELQAGVTKLLHDLAIRYTQPFTLAQLGYLHMNSICYVNGEVQAKIYFAPELAITTTTGFGGRQVSVPNPKFEAFHNWLFVGSLKGAIEYDTLTVPKYHIDEDSSGQPAISITGGKKVIEDAEVVVLRCNPLCLMAAITGVSMADPNFDVSFETIGKSDKKTGSQIMISAGANQQFPVKVTVAHSTNAEYYDPDLVVPCLLDRAKRAQSAIRTRKELALKASEKAEKAAKKRPSNRQLDEYRKYR